MMLTAAEQGFTRTLRLASRGLLLLPALFLLGILLGPLAPLLREPPGPLGLLSGSFLAATLCLYAGGDPRRRDGLAVLAVAVLLLMDLAAVAALVAGAGRSTAFGFLGLTSGHVIGFCAVFFSGIALLIAVRLSQARRARRELNPPAPVQPWASGAPDLGLHIVLPVVGLVFAGLAIVAAIGPFSSALDALLGERLLAAHLAGACAAVAGLCFYVAGDTANRLPVLSPALLGMDAMALGCLLALLGGATGTVAVGGGGASMGLRTLLWALAGALAGLSVLLFLLKRVAYRMRLRPRFLGTTEYRALMALSDVIVRGSEESVPPAEIAHNVDRYLTQIQATRRWVHRATLRVLQLHPVLYAKAPLSELDEEGRLEHLKQHFYRDVLLRVVPDGLRRFVQAMIRVAQQLTYVGYYNDPRSHKEVGYVRFTDRPRYAALRAAGAVPDPGAHPLKVTGPGEVNEGVVDTEVCIIGTGAGGAVLAYELVRQGKDVVMLERGRYVEPRHFTDNEVDMIGKLYADGIFQQTEDFRFTVLQASCVGGSTVVNNAVSFPTPDHVLERWNRVYRAGIEPAAYRASTDHLRSWLSITAQKEGNPGPHPHLKLNPSGAPFLTGIGNGRELTVGEVEANINGCVGCGYCNIGCPWGKKLSMLETALPRAQKEYPGRLRIYSDCRVEKILTRNGDGRRAEGVVGKLPDGRTLTVKADKVIVAAGAVASSYLLIRSGVGRGLPVGRGLCFNMGAPLTAEFEQPLDAHDGLQISHFGLPRPERGWVFETWWNPPVSQAINMPGWFEQHFHNMRRYRHLMAVGALVGTEGNAWVGRALTGGAAINYVPTPGDLRKLGDALIEVGQILFAAGARRVMLNGWEYLEFTSPNGLYEIPAIMRDPSIIALGTGHPQSGNGMSSDPALGVVGPDFRVHGYANLYVCDASVIPSSLTVNPQLSVMALAHYAAPRIAG